MKDEPIARKVCRCSICGAPADRYHYGLQCRSIPGHMADLFVGIFVDETDPPDIEWADEHDPREAERRYGEFLKAQQPDEEV